MNKRNIANIIIKIFLILVIIFMTVGFISAGIVVGIVLNYSDELPELEPLDYRQTATWKQHLEIYSSISEIEEDTEKDFLMDKLVHLEYSRINAEMPVESGQYTIVSSKDNFGEEMNIYLRGFHYPRQNRTSYIVKVYFDEDNKIARIEKVLEEEKNGNLESKRILSFELEPELISELQGDEEGTTREIVRLKRIPENLLKAFIAIEDVRFYQHWGIDTKRVLGAFWYDIRTMSMAQGASTITQQLACNLFLSKTKKISRKIKEALLSVKIESKYSKDEILEYYLNFIDLGRYGARQLYGVQGAAESYFDKPVWELELHECATLAGIPKSPTLYSPLRNPDNAQKRRNLVLKAMLDNDFITQSQYSESINKPLEVNPPEPKQRGDAPHFLEYVQQKLEEKYQPGFLYNQGLRVYTTIDMTMQRIANRVVPEYLKELDEELNLPDYEKNKKELKIDLIKSYLQGALVSIEPQTGYIRAMLGGREYYVNRRIINFFNRAVSSPRQPGSAFKPFVITAAFSANPPIATAATVVEDEPWFTIDDRGEKWSPRNYKGRYYGKVTVRRMIEKSINVATAKFMNERVGIERTIQTARKLGIKSQLDPYPSLALGSSGITPLEMASAYGVFADSGMRAEPMSVVYVEDRQENIIEENKPIRYRAIDEEVAYLVTYILQGVIEQGTGIRARIMGFDRPAAGKTGTTNDFTDAWFVGFVPELVTSVWIGFDNPQKSTKHEGAHAALPIWTNFMKESVQGRVKRFRTPDGIVFEDINKETGRPANINTPEEEIINEAFISRTESYSR